jgi:hypothetical protein
MVEFSWPRQGTDGLAPADDDAADIRACRRTRVMGNPNEAPASADAGTSQK